MNLDCNNIINFFKEFKRMCDSHGLSYEIFIEDNLEKAIAIVQKWSDDHPQKTLLEDFKEKYPNYCTCSDGMPSICPKTLGYEEERYCKKNWEHEGKILVDCKECWNRPLEEVKK